MRRVTGLEGRFRAGTAGRVKVQGIEELRGLVLVADQQSELGISLPLNWGKSFTGTYNTRPSLLRCQPLLTCVLPPLTHVVPSPTAPLTPTHGTPPSGPAWYPPAPAG